MKYDKRQFEIKYKEHVERWIQAKNIAPKEFISKPFQMNEVSRQIVIRNERSISASNNRSKFESSPSS